MTSNNRERSLVVIELAGGNDALNTIIPYNNGLYYDFRPSIAIPQEDVLGIDGELGFNPNMVPFKHLWDKGILAVINGIGYPNPNRSHFRSRDVWHTAEPEKVGAEGWLGATIRDLDPQGDNVLTGVQVPYRRTHNNRIQKFTANGRFLLRFGLDLSLPWGLTVDARDEVYVADWGNDCIQKFSTEGVHLATYGTSGGGDGEFHHPAGVAVDDQGYIYVADWGNERVQVLDPDGGFVIKLRGEATLSKWAENFLSINVEEGKARATANLEPEIEYFVDDPHEESSHIEKYFWSPCSVKLDGAGRLYVTESNRHRIQVFNRSA